MKVKYRKPEPNSCAMLDFRRFLFRHGVVSGVLFECHGTTGWIHSWRNFADMA
jgi:hypothetical protein